MILGLITGVIIGFLLSMPPLGPTNFAIMSKGFRNDIKAGVLIGAGAGFMDMIYIITAYGGLSLIKTLIPYSVDNFLAENENYFKSIITLIGCVIVFVTGIKIMKTIVPIGNAEEDVITRDKLDKQISETEIKVGRRGKEIDKILHTKALENKQGLMGNFFTGVLYCLSSVTLPASWFAIVSYMKSYGIIDSRFITGFALSVGVLSGTTLWFYVLVRLISRNSYRISRNNLDKINYTVGIILIGLGIFLFYKAFDFFFS